MVEYQGYLARTSLGLRRLSEYDRAASVAGGPTVLGGAFEAECHYVRRR